MWCLRESHALLITIKKPIRMKNWTEAYYLNQDFVFKYHSEKLIALNENPFIFLLCNDNFSAYFGGHWLHSKAGFQKVAWVDLMVYEHRWKNLLSKLRTVIMNAYNDELTLHSKICQTDVARYSAKLWDWAMFLWYKYIANKFGLGFRPWNSGAMITRLWSLLASQILA